MIVEEIFDRKAILRLVHEGGSSILAHKTCKYINDDYVLEVYSQAT